MLFDGPADLPTAILRSRASEARHRVIAGHLYRWLALRWSWLRPRTVPLIVAFAGMLALLGATKYLSAYARGDLLLDGPVQRERLPTYGYMVSEPSVVEPQVQPRAACDARVQDALPTGYRDHGGRSRLPSHLTDPAIGAAAPVEITLDQAAARR